MSGGTAAAVQREPELAGQTVVVIGGSAGIGLETARRARAEGAEVILTGRDPVRLIQAAKDVGAQRTAAFDANDTACLQRFVRDLPAPIDHVMVTAGGPVGWRTCTRCDGSASATEASPHCAVPPQGSRRPHRGLGRAPHGNQRKAPNPTT